MTVKQAGAVLQCSGSMVYKLLYSGQISCRREGRRRYPDDESVEAYKERNVVEALPQEPGEPRDARPRRPPARRTQSA